MSDGVLEVVTGIVGFVVGITVFVVVPVMMLKWLIF